jgi:ubiquitin C-terminal hydrolase
MYEALTAFVQGDVLDEDNQYMCEKCDKKVDALKRVVIKKLPRYLICTLKRFEFDMDTMMRVKVNDLFDFPHDLDLSKYTQDYLSKKAKGGEFTLKYHADYYNYELVGIVVHSGTADSGHYYSYIKEQERFEANQQEKWFEFNDTMVRDFDKSEIPSECFGGVE